MKKETMEKIIELSSFVNSLEFVGKSDIQERIGKIILCEMNDQKIGKFDLYSLASDDETVKSLMGVYHKDGYKYVTNKHILCKTKQDYAPQLDGRVVMADGSLLPLEETRVPRFDAVIPADLKDYIAIDIDFQEITEWKKEATVHKKLYGKSSLRYVSVLENTAFAFEDFILFVRAMQAFGLNQIMVHEKERTKFAVSKNDETVIVLCPSVRSINDADRYSDDIKWFKL